MVCMYCARPLEVANTRKQQRSNQVWRRRRCPYCDVIFTTHEAIDLSKALVVQCGTELVPFIREKLFVSIFKSCQHRASALGDAAALAETVIKKVTGTAQDGRIANTTIAHACLETLRSFDNAAAVQYEAFHVASLQD